MVPAGKGLEKGKEMERDGRKGGEVRWKGCP